MSSSCFQNLFMSYYISWKSTMKLVASNAIYGTDLSIGSKYDGVRWRRTLTEMVLAWFQSTLICKWFKISWLQSFCKNCWAVLLPTSARGEDDGSLLKIGGFWYKLDGCYKTKRRWVCARGCGARLHTIGKRIVFSEFRHFCRTNNHTI